MQLLKASTNRERAILIQCMYIDGKMIFPAVVSLAVALGAMHSLLHRSRNGENCQTRAIFQHGKDRLPRVLAVANLQIPTFSS